MTPRSRIELVRQAALVCLAVFAVHELRYAIGYGGEASHQLAIQGHAYLGVAFTVLAPGALALVALTLVGAARLPLLTGFGARTRFATAAFLHGAAVFAIFSCQELAEGVLAAHHPVGVQALVAHGGWVAAPLAAVLGCLLALLQRGLVAVEERIAASLPARAWAKSPSPVRRDDLLLVPLAARPLAFGIARRPPPAIAPVT